MHTISWVYKDYEENVKAPIDKKIFVEICNDFNVMIFDYLLEGKEFNMGYNLSTLSIVRIERDPNFPKIDWGESNKYKQELLDEGERLYNHETGKGVKWYRRATNLCT